MLRKIRLFIPLVTLFSTLSLPDSMPYANHLTPASLSFVSIASFTVFILAYAQILRSYPRSMIRSQIAFTCFWFKTNISSIIFMFFTPYSLTRRPISSATFKGVLYLMPGPPNMAFMQQKLQVNGHPRLVYITA